MGKRRRNIVEIKRERKRDQLTKKAHLCKQFINYIFQILMMP